MSAAGGYIENAIQEMMVVKKETEHPRILPSLEHMKIVSFASYALRVRVRLFFVVVVRIQFCHSI